MKAKKLIVTCLSLMFMGIGIIQAQPKLFVGPNQPLGEGKGIHPGRVVWVHSPGVAKWDLETGLLFLIDGTYGSRDVNGKPQPKWQKPPFNNDWCCSIIVSQDGVACDAVGLDMLVGEWPEFRNFNYCDEYLREAATIPNPVSGTTYDPECDGTPLTAPLGLMEHWNNAQERKYTKLDLIYRLIK